MFIIKELPEKSNGSLGVVLIELGHVEIINEVDQKGFTLRSPGDTSLLLKWRKTELKLELVSVGVEVEVHNIEQIVLRLP